MLDLPSVDLLEKDPKLCFGMRDRVMISIVGGAGAEGSSHLLPLIWALEHPSPCRHVRGTARVGTERSLV